MPALGGAELLVLELELGLGLGLVRVEGLDIG
jgi:hypothetical protein